MVGVEGVNPVDGDCLLLLRLVELVHPVLRGDHTQDGGYDGHQLTWANPLGGQGLGLSPRDLVGENIDVVPNIRLLEGKHGW